MLAPYAIMQRDIMAVLPVFAIFLSCVKATCIFYIANINKYFFMPHAFFLANAFPLPL